MLRRAIVHPRATGPFEPAFRRHGDGRSIARPRAQRLRDQSLVVAGLAIVVTIGIGCVEQRGTGVERGMDDRDAARIVASLRRRQAHAAKADRSMHEWASSL